MPAGMSAILKRLAVVVLLAVLLSGCSAVKLAYNNADDVVAWMADDYLDLHREQEEGLKPLLARFHAWHRTTQLREYARLLEVADRRLSAGLTAADVAWATGTVEERYRIVATRLSADAARVLATLSDEQVGYLRRKLDEGNRKWSKEHGVAASAEEQKRLRAKRLLDRIEHWTGNLTSAQSARFTELMNELPLITEPSLQFRMRRQRQFLVLLESRQDGDAFGARLRAWLLDWDRTGAPEYAGLYARFVEGRTRLYVEGYQLLNAEQRQHVASRLRRYSQAFRELADELPRPSSLAW
jgi:hypothetical protein